MRLLPAPSAVSRLLRDLRDPQRLQRNALYRQLAQPFDDPAGRSLRRSIERPVAAPLAAPARDPRALRTERRTARIDRTRPRALAPPVLPRPPSGARRARGTADDDPARGVARSAARAAADRVRRGTRLVDAVGDRRTALRRRGGRRARAVARPRWRVAVAQRPARRAATERRDRARLWRSRQRARDARTARPRRDARRSVRRGDGRAHPHDRERSRGGLRSRDRAQRTGRLRTDAVAAV